MNFLDDLKRNAFYSGKRVNVFIAINVIVFVAIQAVFVVQFLFTKQTNIANFLNNQLSVPTYLPTLLKQPWSVFTYMFMHNGLLHLLFNMLWMYWLGNIFEEYLNKKRLTFVYLAGGLTGALLYILCYNIFPAFSDSVQLSYAVGASASVMAIVVAMATQLPTYTIALVFVGPVKLKWIAVFYVVFDFLSLAGPNAGGHLAHLGGAIFGILYIKSLQKSNDWCKPFEQIFKPKPRLKVVSKNYSSPPIRKNHKPNQSEIDAILDKISQSGYDKLSANEKEILFSASATHEEK
ncbi:MAG: rhomboid family intramembrane serine protease [Sphingobacteriales bacterium]|nr:MAG: rhomboid family intramembrane serine protease [Sphingobacteriales bacterium]TAF79608.1 MAG: rhomboid family intramembrane serine protease [Sphingobacteriales bacterium]